MDGEAEEAQPELHVALDDAEEKVEDIDRVRRHAWLGVGVTVRVRVRVRAAGWMHGRASCEGHRAALPCCAPCRAWCSARIAVRCAVHYMVTWYTVRCAVRGAVRCAVHYTAREATEEGYYYYCHHATEEGEESVEVHEVLVEELVGRWIHEDVEDDVQQPCEREHLVRVRVRVRVGVRVRARVGVRVSEREYRGEQTHAEEEDVLEGVAAALLVRHLG